MKVLYVAYFGRRTGYAQAAHDYALALHRDGVDLSLQAILPMEAPIEERYSDLRTLFVSDMTTDEEDVVIIHAPPVHAVTLAQEFEDDIPKILVTTWETSHLPGTLAHSLDENYDAIVVPSHFCKQAMFGVIAENKLHVIPHTFDPEHWPLEPKPYYGGPPPTPAGFQPAYRDGVRLFVFNTCGAWVERKNPMGLLKAYFAEFSSSDAVRLRMKVPTFNEVEVSMLSRVLGYDDLPQVEIVSGHLEHEDYLAFHHDGDCYVTATRGEGWCLPAFEATVLGKPVIAPVWGGQRDFLDPRRPGHSLIGGQWTPAIAMPSIERVEFGGQEAFRASMAAPSGMTARQNWLEPDLYELRTQMRDRYLQWLEDGTPSPDLPLRVQLERQFGYDTIGPVFTELIGEIRNGNPSEQAN